MAAKSSESRELEKVRIENARLKAENNRLSKMSRGKIKKSPKNFARKSAVVILLIIATAMLTAGNLLFWFGNTIVKPDRFTAATQPIIKNPDVQQAISLYTTNSIFQNIDVEKFTEQVLPPRAVFLAPQLTTQLKSGTQKTLQNTLAKPSFQGKWNNILAKQHDRFINFASQYKGDGTISLTDVYNQLGASLQNTKLSFLADKKLPPKVGSVTVVNATWLPTVHKVVTNIDTWRLITVALFVACVVLAVWLSRNRRKTIYTLSILAAIFMLITLLALRVARETIADKVDPQYAEGMRSALQIFLHPFVLQTATIFFAFALVALVTWVSSTSRSAAALREKVGLIFSGRLHTRLFGEGPNRYVGWVSRNKRVLEWSAVAVVAGLMLLVRLTLKSLLFYALLMLVLVLTVEVIGGKPQQITPPTGENLQKN